MTCLPDEEVRRGVRSYSGSLPRPRTSGARQVRGDDDGDDDICIMTKCLSVCVFVTKNHHFLLGVSCKHLNHP